ncbi:MAG: hypothetical protein NZL93_06770, partial [Chthoniobacterales bacterium]|nr:hypothetical protein [Chthoniobacterales bacterium]
WICAGGTRGGRGAGAAGGGGTGEGLGEGETVEAGRGGEVSEAGEGEIRAGKEAASREPTSKKSISAIILKK